MQDSFIVNNLRDVYVACYDCGSTVPGSARRIRLPDGVFTHPAMSPDGSRVAFWGICGGKIDIWTADTESCEAERLTRGVGSNCHPAWSPNSRKIVFSSDPSYHYIPGKAGVYGGGIGLGRRSLWVADVKRKTWERLAGGGKDYERPAWSSCGGKIAFVLTSGESKDIYVLDIKSGRQIFMAGGKGCVFYRPAWHPEGTSIAFNNKGEGPHYIWTAEEKGGVIRRITPDESSGRPVHDHGSYWSADGKRIIFHSDRSGSWGIWTIDLKSRRMETIPVPGFKRCGHATFDAREKHLSFDSERGK